MQLADPLMLVLWDLMLLSVSVVTCTPLSMCGFSNGLPYGTAAELVT